MKNTEPVTAWDFEKLYEEERFVNKGYIIIMACMAAFMVFLSIRYSSTHIDVQPHFETVDITDLRVEETDKHIRQYNIEFITNDGIEYNLEFHEPSRSATQLDRIMADWNDESKYITLDYDIITYIHYNFLTNDIKTNKKVVINYAASFIKR